MILLDTVVVSELRKIRRNAGVLTSLKALAPDTLFLSVMTLGEIDAGIHKQCNTAPEFAKELSQRLVQTRLRFTMRILTVIPAIARFWGRLPSLTKNKVVDNLVAFSALCHNPTVVTRKIQDFEVTGLKVVNQFAVG